MKKKIWLVVAAVLLVMLLLFLHLVPMRPFGEEAVIEIDKVESRMCGWIRRETQLKM